MDGLMACGHALASKKLGVVVPSTNTVMEPDLYRHVPANVSVHFARFQAKLAPLPSDAKEWEPLLLSLLDGVEEAAVRVSTARCHAIGIGFVIETSYWGVAREKEIVARLQEATKAKVVTAASAVADALTAVGARNIGLVTPYYPGVNELFGRYLSDAGFRVVKVAGTPSETPWACASYGPDDVVDMFRQVNSDAVDVLCAAGTNLSAVEAALRVEKEIGKPVIAGNLALLWRMLREIGMPMHNPALGTLFSLSESR
jgi:maleate isomerase